jgi:hypothetical protein
MRKRESSVAWKKEDIALQKKMGKAPRCLLWFAVCAVSDM